MKAKRIEKILVTGGAGFIGSHTVDLIMKRGYEAIILDNLEPQVHGKKKRKPSYIHRDATFIQHKIQDRDLLNKIMTEVDAVIHLAARVGVGQSMYQIDRYIDANTKATAGLLNVLANKEHDIRKLVVASSMSVYGEGKYLCEKCGLEVYPSLRTEQQLKTQQWEQTCTKCGTFVKPLPTDEDKPSMPTSIYAQSKRHQEEMCLLIGRTYDIPTVALRYFNVYGSRQSLSNPYTGACAIFTSRILNNNLPYIFEDGQQTRDFIHVKDIAQANLKALEHSRADYQAINIGTGNPTTIIKLAETLANLYGKVNLKPYISNEYRKGDIRHCYADTNKMNRLLDFKPATSLDAGLSELVEWARTHGWGVTDSFEKALGELKRKKLAS